jgi:ABC-type Fe3+/spermidine/putrescine transport system ATPase subunit
MKKIVELKNICYRYDKRKTDGITELSFSIYQAQCLCLVGPSGSGKTTTAKIIADILTPQEGEMKFYENTKTAYVAQNTHLPEDLTVFEYLKTKLLYMEEEKKENLIRSNLLLLNISNETHNLLSSISGGQRQRVIIASALIQNPNLIILDEPFGHLDEKLRNDLMHELFELFKDQKIACLWITHEIKEALSFSDRILLLNYGVIQQDDTPENIYQRPQNLFTAEFFGQNNSVVAKLISVSEDDLVVKLFNREIIIPKPASFKDKDQQEVLLIIRPEHLTIQKDGDYKGKVHKIHFQGYQSLIEVKLSDGFNIWLYTDGYRRLSLNEKIQFSINYSRVYCLDEI